MSELNTTLEGMQKGRILATGVINLLALNTLYDIDIAGSDCQVWLSLDVAFDIIKTPTSGNLYLYRRSMILRTNESKVVTFAPIAMVSAADCVTAIALGMKSGCSFAINGGLESFGLAHTFSDGVGNTSITSLRYALRVVGAPVYALLKGK
jgi:hypothetical protein